MPRAPKQCGSCTTTVRGRTYCDPCTARRQWENAGHGSTRAQRALAAQVLTEEPTCACGAPAEHAGHIVAETLGGPYTRDNLTGQCVECNMTQMLHDRITPEPFPF